MKLNRSNTKISYVFICIIVYCISITPSITHVSHKDIHIDCHQETVTSEITDNNVKKHINCTHDKHFDSLKEECLFCDSNAICEHIGSKILFETNNNFLRFNHLTFFYILHSSAVKIYPNKSPPLLATNLF